LIFPIDFFVGPWYTNGMSTKTTKIRVIREIKDEDKTVKEALKIAQSFRVLTYVESYAILEKKLGKLSVETK